MRGYLGKTGEALVFKNPPFIFKPLTLVFDNLVVCGTMVRFASPLRHMKRSSITPM